VSKGQPGKRRAALLVAAALAVTVVVAGAAPVRRLHERRLHVLFGGREVHASGEVPGFCARVAYDLEGYGSEASRASEGAWDTSGADRSTGASKVLRLLAATIYREPVSPSFLTIRCPSEGAVFPPNLCAPFIEWTDVVNDLWQVTLRVTDTPREWVMLSRTRRWRLPKTVWREIVTHAGASDVVLRVKGVKRAGLWGRSRDDVHVSEEVRFRISVDPADNAIVYRLVDPPFLARKTPDTFVRDIRGDEVRPFIRARREYCINCHHFSSTTGRDGRLAIQVRYLGEKPTAHRTYLAVCDLKTQRVTKTRLPFSSEMTTFMSWSPDGTKLATSANQDVSSLAPFVLDAQNTMQESSDLAVYDVSAGTCVLLEGACEPDVLETFPRWTPDGRSIVYGSAPPGRHPQMTRYELKVIPYNDGRGGEPRSLPGPARAGGSCIYPRFSPDGKWFSFVRTAAGSLIKSSSDIWVMPATLDGDPWRLESNVSHAADSWYSWSSNGRWIVFTSKRDDGAFARLYLTHIDDAGHASPAVRLPVMEQPLMSFNVPEFVAEVPTLDEQTFFNGLRMEEKSVRVELAESPPRE